MIRYVHCVLLVFESEGIHNDFYQTLTGVVPGQCSGGEQADEEAGVSARESS